MAKFLDTKGLTEWIPKIIVSTQKELVILSPYLQISSIIYKCLVDANDRGVETTLVYRENKLDEKQRLKLNSLDNLNLLFHPNLHAKCFYNENYLLITSLNLYEYSEKNNREMGVLMHNVNLENPNDPWGNDSDEEIFKDALFEIKSIINSSELEKQSRETSEEGFEMEILKTDKEKTVDYCKILNKVFINKQFEPHSINDNYEAWCFNYYDKIDISLDSRITLYFNFDENHLELLYQKFQLHYNEFMFEGFKFYWNYHGKNKAYLYTDTRHHMWKRNKNNIQILIKKKEGINQFIQLLKPMIIKK
jgi:hypothetical protein